MSRVKLDNLWRQIGQPLGFENRADTFLNLYSDSAGKIAFSVFSTLVFMYWGVPLLVGGRLGAVPEPSGLR